MTILRSLDEAAVHFKRSVIAVGNFDGMHLGHQAIIEKAINRAGILKCPCLIITFDPHPQHVIGRQPTLAILTPIDEKIKLLSTYDIDAVLLIPFTLDFAQIEAKSFVEEVYVKKLCIQEIIVGGSHNFGRFGSGDVHLLESMGAKYSFKTHIFPSLFDGEDTVNSSRIRGLLTSGHVKRAARLLGYHYNILGNVVSGTGRGTQLQFPTANIEAKAPYLLIPKRGVYAVYVHINEDVFQGVMNIGTRPTFGAGRVFYEVHILDFDGDIYHIQIKVEFIDRIRDERRFSSVHELKDQITKDVCKTREILSSFSLKE